MLDYRTILEHINIEVLAIDPKDFTIMATSRAFLLKRNLRKREVVGKKCYQILHNTESPCSETLDFQCPMKEALRKKRPVSLTHTHTGQDGRKFIVNIRNIPVLSDEGEVELCLELIEEVGDRLDQLSLVEQRAAIGLLSEAMAIEINEALTVCRGYIELIEKKCQDAETQKFILNLIKSLEHLEDVVRRFSLLGKAPSIKKEAVSLNLTVEMVTENLIMSGILKDIEINLNLSPEGPLIYASSDLMKQVLVNLLINAVHAMESSGQKVIEIGTSVNRKKQKACLWIKDTGCGIEEDKLDQIFEPFFTTKGEEGTGIGLWVVKLIVEKHKGEIEVRSQVGKGTEFRIHLPLYQPHHT